MLKYTVKRKLAGCGRFWALLGNLLTEGISPRKLALTVALGLVIGVLPLIWGSTLLCALLAYLLRLNQAGIQATNYLAYPLQIALFIPFYRMGAHIFPWGPSVSGEVISLKTDWIGGFPLLINATLKALAAWFVIAPPAAILVYFLVLPVFSRIQPANRTHSREGKISPGGIR